MATILNVESTKPLSKIKGVKVDLPIDDSVLPVKQPYRRVPVNLENAVDQKLNDLLEQDIIERVEGSPTWISPMVVVPKENSQVRICIDMRRANEAIKRENHPLPVMGDFLPHFVGGKYFSKLDVRNAFHQVEISPKSRNITTFITRRGLFRYKRLMFGISCAPEIFQKLMDQILAGCDGCMVFIDDIICYGMTEEQHDQRLTKVLKTLKQWNITLNKEKCVFKVKKSSLILLRVKVWWPKLDSNVDKIIDSCLRCLSVTVAGPPEPMIRKELPTEPWKDLCCDFMGPLPPILSSLTTLADTRKWK